MMSFRKQKNLQQRDIVKGAVMKFGLRSILMSAILLGVVLPEFALAQTGSSQAFGGITQFLKSIAQLLIFEWGYYIGVITLAIQGYRWKTGRIDLMQLGGWGLGIGIVLFAPNIVSELKSHAGGVL